MIERKKAVPARAQAEKVCWGTCLSKMCGSRGSEDTEQHEDSAAGARRKKKKSGSDRKRAARAAAAAQAQEQNLGSAAHAPPKGWPSPEQGARMPLRNCILAARTCAAQMFHCAGTAAPSCTHLLHPCHQHCLCLQQRLTLGGCRSRDHPHQCLCNRCLFVCSPPAKNFLWSAMDT